MNSNIREKLFEYSNNSNIRDNTGMYASMLLLGNNIYTPAGFVDVRQKKIIWIGT